MTDKLTALGIGEIKLAMQRAEAQSAEQVESWHAVAPTCENQSKTNEAQFAQPKEAEPKPK